MNVIPTKLEGVLVIEPRVFPDARGYFLESFHAQRYEDSGIRASFVQDSVSFSVRDVLRGLHLQHPIPQAKLVSVLSGEVFDVAVDVRVGSPSFADWVGVHLSGGNKRQLYIPDGFAHGFCVLSDHALLFYKCSGFYDPPAEVGIRWDDPDIGICWPTGSPAVSDRDARNPLLRDVTARLPRYGANS